MTPHNEATKEQIAKIVLMPGDPLRAKYIAENFLEKIELVNSIRGMLAYTGFYKGKRITVMAHGMGNPSVGIYSYELFKFYDVDIIIRIGSCGAYSKELNLLDIILADKAYSESTYAKVQSGCNDCYMESNNETNEIIRNTAKEKNIQIIEGNVHSSDVFYGDITNIEDLLKKKKCIVVEMESFALFYNAKRLGKKAACILTVTDSLVKEGKLSAKERQVSLNNMIQLALESTLK